MTFKKDSPFWDHVRKMSREAKQMPAWKRGSLGISEETVEVSSPEFATTSLDFQALLPEDLLEIGIHISHLRERTDLDWRFNAAKGLVDCLSFPNHLLFLRRSQDSWETRLQGFGKSDPWVSGRGPTILTSFEVFLAGYEIETFAATGGKTPFEYYGLKIPYRRVE